MFRTSLTCFLLLLLTASFCAAGVISPTLQQELAKAAPDQLVPVYLLMTQRPDIQQIRSLVRNLPRNDRSEVVYAELTRLTNRSQYNLLTYLQREQQRGHVAEIKPIRICNGIALNATPAVLRAIAQREDVYQVNDNSVREHPVPVEQPLDELDEIGWSIEHIGAVDAWRDGYTGEGILIAIIDTGVNWDHADLVNHLWDGGEEYPNHGWDFYDNDDDPTDLNGHGTSAAGILCGDGSAGDTTGVAPGATLMVLRVRNTLGSGVVTDTWLAQDFELDHGVDVSSMSLGWGNPPPEDRPVWRDNYDVLEAAGIISVKSAGNNGHVDPPNSISIPGGVPSPWRHPSEVEEGTRSGLVTVGATDQEDEVTAFSSRGPSTWGGVEPYDDYPFAPPEQVGLIKPDVTAPGVNGLTISLNDDNGYAGFGMTSMACPHGAGSFALLLSKNPDLTPVEMDSLLELFAVDLGAQGKDNEYGAGRIDVIAALDAIPVPMGTLSGTILDANTGEGMAGVRVEMVERPRRHAYTDSLGHYEFEVQTGTYTVRAVIPPLPEQFYEDVVITEGETTTQDGEIEGALLPIEVPGFSVDFHTANEFEDDFLDLTNTGASTLHVELYVEAAEEDTIPLLDTLRCVPLDLGQDQLRGITSLPNNEILLAAGYSDSTDKVYICNDTGYVYQHDQILQPEDTVWTLGWRDLAHACHEYHQVQFYALYSGGIYEYDRYTGPVEDYPLEYALRAISGVHSPERPHWRWDDYWRDYWAVREDNGVIYGFDSAGDSVGYPTNLYIDGLAWFWGDPDGYPLYMVGSQIDSVSNRLYKMNPGSGDIVEVGELPLPAESYNVVDLTELRRSEDDPCRFILAGIANSPEDSVGYLLHWNLGRWYPWVEADPVSLTIEPEQTETVDIWFYAYDLLRDMDHAGQLRLEHNTLVGETILPITLSNEYAVDEDDAGEASLPTEFSLDAPWPNPFNPVTRIGFALPHSAPITVSVYDVLGRLVTVLAEGRNDAGRHTVTFEAAPGMASGMYFVRLETENGGVWTRKMVLLK